MLTMEVPCGTQLSTAIREALVYAQARREDVCFAFNGTIVTVTLDCDPAAVEAAWRAAMNAKSAAYYNSPEGRLEQARWDAEVAAAQAMMTEVERTRDMVLTGPLPCRVAWLRDLIIASSRGGVALDYAAIKDSIEAAGYSANMNTHPNYDGDDAENAAGWIFGQVLTFLPGPISPALAGACEVWLRKFAPASAEEK